MNMGLGWPQLLIMAFVAIGVAAPVVALVIVVVVKLTKKPTPPRSAHGRPAGPGSYQGPRYQHPPQPFGVQPQQPSTQQPMGEQPTQDWQAHPYGEGNNPR